MNRSEILQISKRNMDKAKKTYECAINKSGITEEEKINLSKKLEYATIVYNHFLYLYINEGDDLK